MKKLFVTAILIFTCSVLFYGQVSKKATLAGCQEKAVQNYPLSGQFDILKNASDVRLENLNTNYLPKLDLNGQITWQSEVTKVAIDLPPAFNVDIPEPSKDQYRFTLDISQTIYDGGITRKQKELEMLELDVQTKSVDLELYRLKERITRLYFNIIILKKNEVLLKVLRDNVSSRLSTLESVVKHGAALNKDANILKAEILKIDQNISEILINLDANLKMLSELTYDQYSFNTIFEVPEVDIGTGTDYQQRIEYAILGLTQKKIIQRKNLVSSINIPKVFGFGTAGYGKPGLNMLSDEFDTFFMVGAKLNWSIWDWDHNKNEKMVLDLQQDLIEIQKEAFNKNLQIDLTAKIAQINKYNELLAKDLEIISLKSEIAKISSAELENGIITSNDFLIDLNAETQAKLNYELHKVMLVKAKLDYLTAKGDL